MAGAGVANAYQTLGLSPQVHACDVPPELSSSGSTSRSTSRLLVPLRSITDRPHESRLHSAYPADTNNTRDHHGRRRCMARLCIAVT
jgi:hypothetical protein